MLCMYDWVNKTRKAETGRQGTETLGQRILYITNLNLEERKTGTTYREEGTLSIYDWVCGTRQEKRVEKDGGDESRC